MRRIVVGVDGSAGSRAALAWALRQAEATGAELEAVLAYGSELAWIDVGTDYQQRWQEHAARRAGEELRRSVEETVPASSPVPVHQVVVEDSPAGVLVSAARGAELLVVGSRGRGAVAGLLLGSVSRRCTEHAPCPVVVVPEAT